MIGGTGTGAEARVQRRGDVLWRMTGTAVVLLPLEAKDPVVLAGSGSWLWDVLAEPLPTAGVAPALAERYGLDVEAIRRDVEQALTTMRAHGLLQDVG